MNETAIEKVHRLKARHGLGIATTCIALHGIPQNHALACDDINVAHDLLQHPCTSTTYERVVEVCEDILDTEHMFLTRIMNTKECAELVRGLTALCSYVADVRARFGLN
jgi:hypothetical protein